jgi:hypothetical protein
MPQAYVRTHHTAPDADPYLNLDANLRRSVPTSLSRRHPPHSIASRSDVVISVARNAGRRHNPAHPEAAIRLPIFSTRTSRPPCPTRSGRYRRTRIDSPIAPTDGPLPVS